MGIVSIGIEWHEREEGGDRCLKETKEQPLISTVDSATS